MSVAIAVPVLAAGDAVGLDALGMAAVLRSQGESVQFYAEKSLVNEDVLPLAALNRSLHDTLIYHHSHGCSEAVNAALAFPGRVVVKYHNVTPPAFFPEGGEVRAAAEAGLAQVKRLAAAKLTFWVDSAFNAEGLNVEVHVLPPFMQTQMLLTATPDADTAMALDSAATTVLIVGRVAPNKAVTLALEAFARYRESDPTARLIIAGGHVFADYSERVERSIRELQLTDSVIITGRVTVPQLKALYLAADCLLVASAHEGFCVPLVEAMALGVPIVAVNTTAIPGTAGDAACLVEATAPALHHGLDAVIRDRSKREAMLNAGFRRFRTEFDNACMERRFLELYGRYRAGWPHTPLSPKREEGSLTLSHR
jgi:glycosyltransferase involved in cell wall biosynthesis